MLFGISHLLRIIKPDLIKGVNSRRIESVSRTFEFEHDIGVLVFLAVLD